LMERKHERLAHTWKAHKVNCQSHTEKGEQVTLSIYFTAEIHRAGKTRVSLDGAAGCHMAAAALLEGPGAMEDVPIWPWPHHGIHGRPWGEAAQSAEALVGVCTGEMWQMTPLRVQGREPQVRHAPVDGSPESSA
jgi:hypothetical protein